MEKEMRELKKCPGGSVGIIFKRPSDGKYLMFRRLGTPPGWAGVAGHLKEEEPLLDAIAESEEEVGVRLTEAKLLFGPGTIYPNPCGRDGGIYNAHDWYVYQAVKWKGEPVICEPEHHADLGWFGPEEIKEKFANEPCDPAWHYIFSKLGII